MLRSCSLEFVPDARQEGGWGTVAAGLLPSFAAMAAFQWLVLA